MGLVTDEQSEVFRRLQEISCRKAIEPFGLGTTHRDIQ